MGVAPMPLVVVTVIVLVHEVVPGLHEAGLKEAKAPGGRPEAERVTGWEVPPVRVTVMILVLLVVAPCVTEMSVFLEREKPNALTVRLNATI